MAITLEQVQQTFPCYTGNRLFWWINPALGFDEFYRLQYFTDDLGSGFGELGFGSVGLYPRSITVYKKWDIATEAILLRAGWARNLDPMSEYPRIHVVPSMGEYAEIEGQLIVAINFSAHIDSRPHYSEYSRENTEKCRVILAEIVTHFDAKLLEELG